MMTRWLGIRRQRLKIAQPAVAVEIPICVALTMSDRRDVSFAHRTW